MFRQHHHRRDIGLDDWEWGRSRLFAQDVFEVKSIVYEMRFDEVSARFAEFRQNFLSDLQLPLDLLFQAFAASWKRTVLPAKADQHITTERYGHEISVP